MQYKRYRVHNMEQAYNAARRDLGSDAILFGERKVRQKGLKGMLGKRVLEVTFAYDPARTPSVLKKNALLEPAFLEKVHGKKESTAAVYNEKLEKRIDSFEATLMDFMNKFDVVKRDITYDYPEEVQSLLIKMIEAQVREELAHSLAKQTEKLMRSKPDAAAVEILEHLLQEQFGRPAPILHKKFTQKIVLVLGPTGVGKTTSIVKLAADLAIRQRKNVGIINTDTYRIAAQEQLKIYADIIKAPISLIYYPEDAIKVLEEEMPDRDIIFVDTAGKRPGDEKHREDLLELVKILKPEDVLLCLSATTSFASVKEMIDTYGFIDDYRLMVTKLDETKYRGTLLNICWYARKPIAYVTTGQNVPDDIEVADIEKLVKEIIS